MRAHAGQSDENKLEYTPIFEQYAKLVEQYVDRRLVEKGVDLEQFMKDLPAYIDSPEAHPRTGAVLELLTSFDSFMAFKDMMLEAKKAKVAGGDEIADNANTFSADLSGASFLKENLEWTRLLEQGGAADGWSLIADKKWIQTHRKKDPESPINLTRCFATCNMPADKFMEIFSARAPPRRKAPGQRPSLSTRVDSAPVPAVPARAQRPPPRSHGGLPAATICSRAARRAFRRAVDPNIKTKWDEEVSSCEIIGGGGYDKDGYIVRQIIKIPLISQREMLWRWRWVRDHPEPGAHTAVVYSEPTDIPPLPNTYRVTAKSAQLARAPIDARVRTPPPPIRRPSSRRARPSATSALQSVTASCGQ